MNTLYFAAGIIIIILGILTFFIPHITRYLIVSRTDRPRTTAIITVILGIILVFLALR